MEIEKIQKIAIFRALQLGDMLCIIPAIRALKTALPDASLTLIGLPWQYDFANRFHYFDHFIEFPGWPGLPEQEADPVKAVAFLKYMQDQHYDLVLQMQGNGAITNTMCMLWGASKVAGLRKPGEYCADEKLFPVSGDDEHEVLRFLKLTDALGIPQQGTYLEFPFLEEENERFNRITEALGLSDGQYICIHPGARDLKRRWPARNFALTGDHLASKGYKVVLTGSENERSLLKETADQMQYPVINSITQLDHVSLGDLASIIAHSSLLISNDTGVSHIAAALRIPSVVIFSPYSDRGRWAPLDASLHRAIPFEEAVDLRRVITCAFEQLSKHHRETITSHYR